MNTLEILSPQETETGTTIFFDDSSSDDSQHTSRGRTENAKPKGQIE